jgi:hypothetical protein
MPLKPFDASRLKLKRARHHIGELMSEISAFLGRTPFYLEIALGLTPDTKRWIVRVREEVPSDFSAIIGDAIHNLRAALDLMACELVRLNGQDDSDVYFPFSASEAVFDRAIKRCNMDRASAEAVAVLRSLKPYRGGNEALRAVHDLDIMDKHRALIPTTDMVGAPDVPWANEPGASARFGPIRDGMSVPALVAQSHLPIRHWARGEFVLRFSTLDPSGNRAGPLGGGELVPTLKGLAELVDGIVEAFEALHR